MLSIKKSTYGIGTGNAIRIDVGSLTLWFSYDTIVAFQDGFRSRMVSENCWGSTTGKHLNAIDHANEYPRTEQKKYRLKRADFEAALEAVLKAHGLSI